MNRKKIVLAVVIILIFILAVLALFGWQYYHKPTKVNPPEVNYLINGVPYYGFYNLYLETGYVSSFASVLDVLGYWGDDRFSLRDISTELSSMLSTSEATSSKSRITFLDIKNFFEKNGYESSLSLFNENSNDVIEQLKKFVNSQKNMPVIITQKLVPQSVEDEDLRWGMRVLIGIFDDSKKVVVHDYFFGNNFEIPYDDFQKMFRGNSGAMLAVRPSDKIEGLIKGPDYQAAYPARLEAMDKLGEVLATSGAAAWMNLYEQNFEKSTISFKELIGNSNFKYLPRAFQVSILSYYADGYLALNKIDEAINIIEKQTLPLNQDLSKDAPPGWFVPSFDKFAVPYYVLAKAYLQKGQRELALKNYQEMIHWQDINNEITEQRNIKENRPPKTLPDLRIPELEK